MTRHAQELADHELEHVAAHLWTGGERGSVALEDLRRTSRVDDIEGAIQRLVSQGRARIEDHHLHLTDAGREMAEGVVRRHRLAEILFSAVLDVADDRVVNRTACVMEHVLSPAVTDSVCSFLGHPKSCPHGRPIPAGACCRAFSNAIEPLVQPLANLGIGRDARIVYIVPKDPERLVKLSNLGLFPGAVVRLQQMRPATIIAIGESTLALDRDIAGEIYVKKLG